MAWTHYATIIQLQMSAAILSSPRQDINGKQLLTYGLARYLFRGMLSPWDTSKILQQLNYLPGDDYLKKTGQLTPMPSGVFPDEALDEIDDEDSFEDVSYTLGV